MPHRSKYPVGGRVLGELRDDLLLDPLRHDRLLDHREQVGVRDDHQLVVERHAAGTVGALATRAQLVGRVDVRVLPFQIVRDAAILVDAQVQTAFGLPPPGPLRSCCCNIPGGTEAPAGTTFAKLVPGANTIATTSPAGVIPGTVSVP